jgi:hypothetical protein
MDSHVVVDGDGLEHDAYADLVDFLVGDWNPAAARCDDLYISIRSSAPRLHP